MSGSPPRCVRWPFWFFVLAMALALAGGGGVVLLARRSAAERARRHPGSPPLGAAPESSHPPR